MCIFFFKKKAAYEVSECDWSSDVCCSDLFAVVLFRVMVLPSVFPLMLKPPCRVLVMVAFSMVAVLLLALVPPRPTYMMPFRVAPLTLRLLLSAVVLPYPL